MRFPIATGNFLIDGERYVNLAPVTHPSGELELHGIEGQEEFVNLGAAPLRGLYVMSKDETRMFAVAGGKFYRIATDGTVTEKGSLLTSQGIIGMADNGLQIIIVDGPYGYTYTKATDTFAQITVPDFPGAESVAFKDGYFITVDPDSQVGRTCALYDGTAWDALDFASAEGNPDPLIAVDESDENVWFYGKVTTEVWYNAGLEGFPFQRRGGGVLNFGLAAKNSLAKNDQARFFLARTTEPQGERVVVMVRDFTPSIISPRGMNEEMAKFSNITNAEGFAYMREGHSFYVLTFPSDNRTFVYDASEQKWHERSSLISGNDVRWRPRVYAYFNGFHMVGDYSSGKIFKLKTDVYTDGGEEIKRRFITPEARDRESGRRIKVSRLTVPMKAGVGAISGQGSDPLLTMRKSNDKGNTWSAERTSSIGPLGKYDQRVIFRRLGTGYNWNVEFTVSDPVEVKFTGSLIVE